MTAAVWGAMCLVLLVGCGNDDSVDPARQRRRTEVLTVREALRSQPDAPILYYPLGQIYRKYGVADSSRLALERSVELHPAFAQAHQQLAQVYFEAGDLRSSEGAWASTARFAPNNLETWNNLGYVRRKLGDLTGAEEAYNNALGIDATFAETLNNLGQVYRQQARWDMAVGHFHKAMASAPTLYKDRGDVDAERTLLMEIRDRFGRSSREGRYASERLEELGTAGAG